MSRKLVLAAIFLLPFSAVSEEAETEESTVSEEVEVVEVKPEFTLSAELGFLYKTGNSKSGDVKAGFNFRHEKDQWLSLVAFNVLAKKIEEEDENGNDEFKTTDNKWNIVTQTNYTLNPEGQNYLYGNVAYEEDRFSSFEKQSSVSFGWGRNWYKTENTSLFADIGPGYKYDVIAESVENDIAREIKRSLIIQAQALYIHQVNPFVEFRQLFVAKYATKSDENSIFKAETSVTTKLIESLSLKFSFTVDHDTKVEEGFENTNTETSLTLVYSF